MASVIEGSLPLRSIRVGQGARAAASVQFQRRTLKHETKHDGDGATVVLAEEIVVPARESLSLVI
jgi:hypothetical protein